MTVARQSLFNDDELTTGVVILTAWTLVAAAIIYWRDARDPCRRAAA